MSITFVVRGFNRASTQTGNKDSLLGIDFGLKEWNEHSPKEIVRKYREFVYETGAVDAGMGAVIEQKIVDKERKRKYKVSRVDRFRYRTRYFTDAGIIGSKEFVAEASVKCKRFYGVNLRTGQTLAEVQGLTRLNRPGVYGFAVFNWVKRKFTPVGGVEGVYSMKRLWT